MKLRPISDMKVYLAGPGVFRQDAQAWGKRLVAACTAHAIQGLYPLDCELPGTCREKQAQRRWIFANNCSLIQQSDAVFADMRAFRSLAEPDSGTAFEVGFAHALGKPVWLWLPDCRPDASLINRLPCSRQASVWLDDSGWVVEDFAAPINLMLWDAAAGVSFDAQPEEAIASMASWLGKKPITVSRET